MFAKCALSLFQKPLTPVNVTSAKRRRFAGSPAKLPEREIFHKGFFLA
jgi:hypothetical protein